ncbi:hypothetical protein [Nonomuraea sp. NPDC002799]
MKDPNLFARVNRATTPYPRANVLVVLWRWRYELVTFALAAAFCGGAVEILGPASPTVGVVPVAVALWPPARSEAWGRIRCVITAHRIRVGLIEGYVVSRRGKIPMILWCAPSYPGERVWIWCRAGTVAADVERARHIIATTCWAADVLVRPHPDRPHLVRLDVVRRGREPAARPPESGPARGLH